MVVTLSTGSAGTFAPRSMSGPGGDRLAYNVYLDAAYTTVWGTGTGGSSTKSILVAALGSVTVPFYGLLPARQNVTIGGYSDTLILTLNF